MALYKCPDCDSQVQTPAEVDPGEVVVCPRCKSGFVPRAETFSFKEEPPTAAPKPAPRPAPAPGNAVTAKATKVAKVEATPVKAVKAAKVEPAKTAKATKVEEPTKQAKATKVDPDDEASPYGLIKESEEEAKLAEKNKPKFGDVADKFAKSAIGPAAALLVTPANLLVAQGCLTGAGGILLVILGMWPLIFTDAPSSNDDIADAADIIFIGVMSLAWGSLTCLGASKMQNLESYPWSIVGAVLGIVPLLAGIFGLIILRDPRVLAGFREVETGKIENMGEEGAPKKKDDDDEDEEDDEEEEDDDDDEEEEEKPKRRRR